MAIERYDAVVIGAGQSGIPLAVALAEAGWKVALVEREHLGGTCINVGCTPTKTMIASARVAYLARRAPDYGVRAGQIEVDLEHVRRRKREMVESFRDGRHRRVAGAEGIDLLMGEAAFTGPRALRVRLNAGGTRHLEGDKVFIDTGARPAMPPLPGLEHVPVLDSTSIMELDCLPEHLLVLGGGYIGVEFGQMFCRFGSRVTIVQRGPQLLGAEDRDVADELATILREDGVEVLLETQAVRVEPADGAGIELTVRGLDGERVLSGSHLLVSAGRVPNSDRLNLEAAGIQTDEHGYVRVNERLETSVPGVYAMGDVTGALAFTHLSYDDYRLLRTNLLDGGSATTAGRLVPYTVFTDPQLGRVGMTEREARAAGYEVRVAKIPMNYVARALEVDETRGFMKAVVDARTNQILGCAVLGIEGGEIMAMLQIAMLGKLPYTVLRDAIFAHPTLAESLNTLFMALDS